MCDHICQIQFCSMKDLFWCCERVRRAIELYTRSIVFDYFYLRIPFTTNRFANLFTSNRSANPFTSNRSANPFTSNTSIRQASSALLFQRELSSRKINLFWTRALDIPC